MSTTNAIVSLCGFPGCEYRRTRKGLCDNHYRQQLAGKPLTQLYLKKRKRFTPPRIEYDETPCPVAGLNGPCYIFKFGKDGGGYGSVRVNGKKVSVHRYVWQNAYGPVPHGLVLDHRCMVKACCNIDHLRAVTNKVNTTENLCTPPKWKQNAAKTHCHRGHEFSAENTKIDKYGHRSCKACARIAMRKHDMKRRGRRRKANGNGVHHA